MLRQSTRNVIPRNQNEQSNNSDNNRHNIVSKKVLLVVGE